MSQGFINLWKQHFHQLPTLVLLILCSVLVFLKQKSIADKVVPNQGSAKVAEKGPVPIHKFFSADEIYALQYGSAAPDDSRLIAHIKNQWLINPSTKQIKQTSGKKDFSQFGQSPAVDNLLGGRRNGFFVECGATNGRGLSNTLFFELARGWTGLLVEANPKFFRELLQQNRNCYLLNACLSPNNETYKTDFRIGGVLGGLPEQMHPAHESWLDRGRKHRYETVQCFPLYSVMLALNRTHIDYFSLDVEGAEVYILKSIPFDKLKIDALSIEYKVSGGRKPLVKETKEKLQAIRTILQGTGLYREAGVVPPGVSEVDGLDVVFVRSDL